VQIIALKGDAVLAATHDNFCSHYFYWQTVSEIFAQLNLQAFLANYLYVIHLYQTLTTLIGKRVSIHFP
jgi:hypothetical protein